MRLVHRCALLAWLLTALSCLAPPPSHAAGSAVPPEVSAILDKIYSFDLDDATQAARRFQREHPDDPLGFLLEGEALWWRIWCSSAEYKWGMIDVRHRPKLDADHRYFELATRAYSLAIAQNRSQESAANYFYAGMGDALAARLYALRGENRATARVGVRARQNFLRALELDRDCADADFGLGLYNYYVDTLGSLARMLRFFTGIPGGSKQDGVRQLEAAIASGALTPTLARIYLALNLHRYDQRYARALGVLQPVAAKYPGNPLFQLMIADLHAKLGHWDQALAHYRAAAALPVADAECKSRIQSLADSASAAVASLQGSHKQ
jgi:tetratricopeptide (TPR) repeat protein